MQGRRINDSINAIKDCIEDAGLKNKELYLCSFDQKKAFDSMSHKYLFKLLDHLGINKFLNNSVKRIYKQSYAYIVVNGCTSEKLIIRSGIKQGCSVSMFLYCTGIEEFAVCANNNREIIGYTIPKMIMNEKENETGNEIKMTMYADDAGALVQNLKSIDIFIKEFKEWGKISGASLNDDKTKILAINSPAKDHKGIRFEDKVKILGINFSKKGIDKENIEMCFKKIELCLRLWKNIRLDMLERITVIRTFALSKLWYLCNFIILSENDIKKIETMIFKYVWNGAELIKRNTLYIEFKDGGLNMVNVRAKLSMIRIRNMMYIKKNLNRPQYQFSIYWMKFYFREYLVNFNICPCGNEEDRPLLYVDMLKMYKKFSALFKDWCDIENLKRKAIW